MAELVERAKALAYRAHAGQVDKAGRPYIEHVSRVAAAVRRDGMCSEDRCDDGELLHWHDGVSCPRCDEAEAVAWLHDVYEDCEVQFCEELEREFSVWIVAACMRVTRGVYPDYYEAIKEQDIALRVKLADIVDNADEARLALLDEKTADRLRRKYAKALRALTPAASEGESG